MKYRRGFTIIEILVTVTVMVILMTLGVVSIRSTQANARDEERKSDVETIARGLEQFYQKGGNTVQPGTYPGHSQLWNGPAYGQTYTWESYAPGASKATFTSPSGIYGLGLICIFGSPSGYWSTVSGCETPGNMTKIRASLEPDRYGYEPLYANGALCYDNCKSFTLYWISEVDGQVKTLKSRNR